MKNKNLFKNKYRVRTARLTTYDYGWNGMYYVTICTLNKYEYFGEIINNIMIKNDIGKIVENCWYEIPKHFPFVILHNFVVMPNHVHGIIEIAKDDADKNVSGSNAMGRDAINRVSTNVVDNKLKTGGITGSKNSMGKNNLGQIIRWLKGRSTYEINKLKPNYFAWQPRYHDHIIKSDDELYNIAQYIDTNPIHWQKDENNIFNI